jgi:flagellar hook-length control protein FliK
MQNTFSLPVAPSGVGVADGADTQKTQKTARGRKSDTNQDPEAGDFGSFLAACSQALEVGLSGIGDVPSLDLQETLSLRQAGDFLLLSRSIPDLVASVKDGLEERGVDTAKLSEQVEEVLEEILPDPDMERLRSMLSRLRDRYAASPQSDEPGDVTGGLTPEASSDVRGGEEAGVKTPGAAEGEEEEKAVSHAGSILSALFESSATANAEDDAMSSLAFSRIASYLKSDASRPLRENAENATKTPWAEIFGEGNGKTSPSLSESGKNAGSEKDAKSEENAAAAEFSAAAAGAVQTAAGQGGAGGESPGKNSAQGRTGKDEPLADAGSKNPAVSDEAGGETEKPAAAVDRRTSGFEQFFDDVMARRGQFDARPEALELSNSKETPLSEALREGLDNVVRFIRAEGGQKASLIVDPPSLGRVTVELTTTATGLDASIKVSSEQIRQLVQDQIVQLRMSLAQQGVELAHFSVDVQQDNGRQRQGSEQQKGRARGTTDKEDPGPEGQAVFRVDLNQGLLWWVA